MAPRDYLPEDYTLESDTEEVLIAVHDLAPMLLRQLNDEGDTNEQTDPVYTDDYTQQMFEEDVEHLDNMDLEEIAFFPSDLNIGKKTLATTLLTIDNNWHLLTSPRYNYLFGVLLLDIVQQRPIVQSDTKYIAKYLDLLDEDLQALVEDRVGPGLWVRELLYKVILSVSFQDEELIKRLMTFISEITTEHSYDGETFEDGNFGDSLIPYIITKYGDLVPEFEQTMPPYDSEYEDDAEYSELDHGDLPVGITENPLVRELIAL
jgi:predicted house-cleaning noncanonical NTP pyrophosphatase (MazG superfamily)